MHVGCAAGHWLLIVHSTQAATKPKPPPPVRQYGVVVGQSPSVAQATQMCAREQTCAVAEVQSASPLHSTQVDVVTSQWGAIPMHWRSLVQPARHRYAPGSHTGAAVPQSAFDRHATQVWAEARQRGALAGQSELARHCTHCSVVGLQMAPPAAPPPQSEVTLQPMQAPVLVSHMGLRPLHCALPVQAAWHVLLPGQHTGVVPVQPAEPVHCWQRPC
jgi:hypothetical protein